MGCKTGDEEDMERLTAKCHVLRLALDCSDIQTFTAFIKSPQRIGRSRQINEEVSKGQWRNTNLGSATI